MSRRAAREPTVLTRAEARRWLIGHLGLAQLQPLPGAAGVRALLTQLRCIQLDPLDPMGTNADLVALARVDGIARGDVYRHLLPGHAFEHYAKERCLLPASAFPYYRDSAARRRHWWSHQERVRRLPPRVLKAVRAQLEAHGPLTAKDLDDHGSVEAIDWSGWRGTARAGSMALEVLWTRCEAVVCGRSAAGKLYDVPRRALPEVHAEAAGDFARWAIIERAHAAGLLPRNQGPQWSLLRDARTGPLPDRLVREGVLEDVTIEGLATRYLAPAGFRDRVLPQPKYDERVRLLGPLDPLLWDRKLVRHVFDFDYLWEVYKPASKRRWGWYVHPLLFGERFVGRLEGRIRDGALVIDRLWREDGVRLPVRALGQALARHAAACGVSLAKGWQAL